MKWWTKLLIVAATTLAFEVIVACASTDKPKTKET